VVAVTTTSVNYADYRSFSRGVEVVRDRRWTVGWRCSSVTVTLLEPQMGVMSDARSQIELNGAEGG
jgi:hypothetical protein